MVHYTFPPGASEIVSGVAVPEYVIEGGRAAYAYDDSTTEGVMYTIPSALFSITHFSYTPSAAASEGSWLTRPWGTTSSLTVSAASAAANLLSKGTLEYTPVSAITGDYFAFKIERDRAVGLDVSGDFKIVGVTLTF